jgi:hypothetical protein
MPNFRHSPNGEKLTAKPMGPQQRTGHDIVAVGFRQRFAEAAEVLVQLYLIQPLCSESACAHGGRRRRWTSMPLQAALVLARVDPEGDDDSKKVITH